MANIKLKNAGGTEVSYNGVNSITIPNASGDGNTTFSVAFGYTVTLNVDGSTWQKISVAVGASMSQPTYPSVSGKVFEGWSTTSGGSVNVTFPYTPSGDVTLYAIFQPVLQYKASPVNYGASSPSSVSFSSNSNLLNWTPEVVTKDGSTFVKFPTFYRKVTATSGGQITGFIISSWKEDNDFQPYPCFLDESGNLLPYVLMGQYCCTSSSEASSVSGTPINMTPSAGRALCRAKGTGYQQMDWMIFKLWQDLLCAKMQTINTNSGSGITQDVLGVYWKHGTTEVYPWIDGIAYRGVDKTYCFSYKPSKYADAASSSTDGYQITGYTFGGTTGQEIQSLGYDTSHPFLNYPTATVNNSSYSTYYCDAVYVGTSETHPVCSYVGYANANCGAFRCNANTAWSRAFGVRLCYRPTSS